MAKLLVKLILLPFFLLSVACAQTSVAQSSSGSQDSGFDSAAPVGAVGGESYRLAAEDILDIYVWQEDDLKRQVVVRPDGGISFPLAGEILAAGKTVKELEAEITSKIRKYITEAVVSVTVQKVSGYRVFVVGKVNNPGQFVLGSYVNVVQAITMADGVTPFAKKKDIKIVRRMSDGSERVYKFNYAQVEQGKGLDQNILLKAGDTVIVP